MLFSQSMPGKMQQAILIADDDKTIIELLTEVFKRYGLTVFQANNGLDAWEVFSSQPIDFVLTDIKMPGLDGTELSRRIRRQCPMIKIAVMTGGNSEVATRLLNEGTADYFFSKPFNLKKLSELIL
jgi:CheY-like chemotaxis protein